MSDSAIQFFIGLETQVWDALVSGDTVADGSLLTADFVGVYPTVFATRDDHVGQLANGSTITTYTLTAARLVDVAADALLLSYRADYHRSNNSAVEAMYISSLWVRRGDQWLNSFSQDTPAST